MWTSHPRAVRAFDRPAHLRPPTDPSGVVERDHQQPPRNDRRVIRGSGQSAHAVLPRVHRVASLLKRWLLGTHQGAVSREHLDYYLDEFTFRFNRRTSRHRGKLFYRLLEEAVAVDSVPYASMVKGIRGRKRQNRHHNMIVGT